jgi:hypothetical protein
MAPRFNLTLLADMGHDKWHHHNCHALCQQFNFVGISAKSSGSGDDLAPFPLIRIDVSFFVSFCKEKFD